MLGDLSRTAVGVDLCLCGRKAGDGHAVRRAGHVVETEVIVDLDGLGVATGLAADAADDVRVGLVATLDANGLRLTIFLSR